MWGVAVTAYAVAVFQRTSLGVAAGPATARFGIGASVLSTFAVVQLVVYAAMQVPVGVLVDRFGSRRLIAAGALLMAAGQAALSVATAPGTAVAARALVGAGDALTFISVLRVIPAWFPTRRVPLVTQLTGQVGQLGQVASTVPLVALLARAGWTAAYLGAAAVAVLTAALVLATLLDRPPGSPVPAARAGWRQVATDLQSSFTHPGTRLGLWSHFSTQFSGMAFALLWGYPFLTTGLGYPAGLAGGLLTVMVLAAAVIGPVLGQLTAAYPLRRSNLIFGVLTATVAAWTAVLLWPGPAPLPLVLLLLLVLAAYGPASAVGFDFARSFNPTTRLGTASGIVNMGGFTASLLTILAIGLVLDWRAPGGGYALGDFKLAFSCQYLLWAFGYVSLWRSRRLTRAGMAAQGTTIDPLPSALARHWRARSHG